MHAYNLKYLMLDYRIYADDLSVCKQRVHATAAGIPGKLQWLVKYNALEPRVKAREIARLGQGSVNREEHCVALGLILLALVGV